MNINISVFLFVIFLGRIQAHGEKRILLNDPDLIHSQIQALESKYQDILTKYADLSTKYTDVSTKYADLSMKYTDVSTKNTALATKCADLSAHNADLAVKYHHLSETSNAGGVFIRWGRKECPSNQTELVYSGFAGGSWYNDEGGAAEYVCLPRDPNLATKFSGNHAKMYGSEYNSLGAPFGLHDGDDVPCAVCRSSRETSVLMIPGKNSCYTGWAMQYHGYLVAGYYAYKGAGQYICLDEHPETLTAGGHNEDGKLIYPVQAVCGSLPCPPYENGKYLTCAVCAK
ncbi:uncharacterized protein LOC125649921 [Ostrea edulis]|uniref:uncharacterized protein LOC125649921 n=1 Tax=Ostrea edulis TaxID=37623 RepID=UPI0024AFAA3A|nr:uncharacterized protein LOC125649921 [Ostrea edulis]